MGVLKFRLFMVIAVLFGIAYAASVMIGTAMGVTNFYSYALMAFGMLFFQYLIGPFMVNMSYRVKTIGPNDNAVLYGMVSEMAIAAKIKMPKVGIADIGIPNAFAYGNMFTGGHVCVTPAIMNLLNKRELRAVIGHEISHLKNNDVFITTMVSVVPMIMFFIGRSFMFSRGSRREHNNLALVGLAAFILYFVSNLLVLYVSRIREYFADRGSVDLGNPPDAMASSLFKLVYGSARTDREQVRQAEGFKAFFVNDPSQAQHEILELRQLDLNGDNSIDMNELQMLKNNRIKVKFSDRLMEGMSTHPNMLKRIKKISEYA